MIAKPLLAILFNYGDKVVQKHVLAENASEQHQTAGIRSLCIDHSWIVFADVESFVELAVRIQRNRSDV
jgi:hypothetical protein